MKALFIVLGSCIVVALVFAASSKDKAISSANKESEANVAKQNTQTPDPKEKPVKAKLTKDMTAQELVDGITKVLDRSADVMDYVPGFKQEKGPEGKEYYTYNGTKLEKLDKEKLAAIYNRVRQERTRLNTERINRQLETIRQAQQAANVANQASRIPTVTQPPAQPPRIPPAPPPTPRR